MKLEIIDDLNSDNASEHQMEVDRELLAQAANERGFCRLYRWREPWVTIGKFQSPTMALTSHQVPYSVRPTGGGAVLHGHDLTIAIALPLQWLDVRDPRNVKLAYRMATQPIVLALKACDVPVALGENLKLENESQKLPNCFSMKSKNDIVSLKTGRKICGCAQVVEGKTYLLQASIPFEATRIEVQNWIQGYDNYSIEPWNHIKFSKEFFRLAQECFDRNELK